MEIRTTLYLEEDLFIRFREACTKKNGDKQGKIKLGYVVAITDYCNNVLGATFENNNKKLSQENIELIAKKLAMERKNSDVADHKILT